jgi:hypothetical protein
LHRRSRQIQVSASTPKVAARLKVVALLSGPPHAQELWTLRAMKSVDCDLTVVQARQATTLSASKRIRRLIKEYGVLQTGSRFLGGKIGDRVARKDRPLLDGLFDLEALTDWWQNSGIVPVPVKALNHAEAQAALSEIKPDIIVRVSGGILKPHIFSLARLITINIHHGQAPLIRGMWSIPWGILEGRSDWIGATVHVIDAGIDTGAILWRGGPQLAPGDTTVDLLFRTHLEAVAALTEVLKKYAAGDETLHAWTPPPGEVSVYRSAANLGDWLKLLWMGRGRRAPVLISKGIES